eukprot:8661480-Lingulodinium_polyedra.AAC.1
MPTRRRPSQGSPAIPKPCSSEPWAGAGAAPSAFGSVLGAECAVGSKRPATAADRLGMPVLPGWLSTSASWPRVVAPGRFRV